MADEPTGVHMTAPDGAHEGAHDEPTAIRHPKRTVWHRWRAASFSTRCGSRAWTLLRQRIVSQPLSQTAPEDRCRNCWPTTKETPDA